MVVSALRTVVNAIFLDRTSGLLSTCSDALGKSKYQPSLTVKLSVGVELVIREPVAVPVVTSV